MKVAILGYGKEGKAAEAYFRVRGAEIEIFDPVDAESIDKIDTSCYNLILRSPSVPPRAGISSVTKYFFEQVPAPIIGVTGTKGKGTTCSMITEVLRALGHRVWLVGNIGVPAIAELDKIKKDDVVVYEMSSFQLWDLEKSPHIAVILRIEPDHLNVHRDFRDYLAAKGHIAEYQGPDDSVVYFRENANSAEIARLGQGQKIAYPIEVGAGGLDSGAAATDVPNEPAELKGVMQGFTTEDRERLVKLKAALVVPGEHNRENAEAALLAVAAFLGQPLAVLMREQFEALRQGLANFKGLAHHLEWVRQLNGVDYYDDSFSASEPSLEVALKTFAGRSVVLIAGGKDRGLDLARTKKVIFGATNLAKALLIGETSAALAQGEAPEKYELVESLAVAVQKAQKIAGDLAAGQGPVVLLSPGAASFDMFRDFYDRGDQFQQLVKELK